MKRFIPLVLTAYLLGALGACGAANAGKAVGDPTPTPARTSAPKDTVPSRTGLATAQPAEGWAERYVAFAEDNTDIFTALWPEGMAGAGFVDLDLDGTPELALFDMGASAAMGVQLFDLTEDGVVCVSSTLETAGGAFGEEYLSKLTVCASFFESFRLGHDGEAYFFWIDSSNGTLEAYWNELIRFGCDEGVLTLESVCGRYLQGDVETGVVVEEEYTVGGEPADAETYAKTEAAQMQAEDLGYDAKGVFVWSAAENSGEGYDDLAALVQAAAEAYVPIEPQDDTTKK